MGMYQRRDGEGQRRDGEGQRVGRSSEGDGSILYRGRRRVLVGQRAL